MLGNSMIESFINPLDKVKNEIWEKLQNNEGESLLDKYGSYFANNTSFSLFIARFLFTQSVADLHHKLSHLVDGEKVIYDIPNHISIKFTKTNERYKDVLCPVIKAHIRIVLIENGVSDFYGMHLHYVSHDEFDSQSCLCEFEHVTSFYHYFVREHDDMNHKLI